MSSVKRLRDSYAETTRHTLLETGRRLFVTRGYPAVAAEELVRAAGLSRGALYHHFNGKRGLFEAVFEELEDLAAQRIQHAMATETDPWQRAIDGMAAFLDVCAEPDYREIVLLQGPIALGWQRWRELDHQHLGRILTDGVRALLDARLIHEHPAELLAGAIYGALTEISLTIATADDPKLARAQAGQLAIDLLTGLTTAPPA
jgi:AcrR family transcriptional regulator